MIIGEAPAREEVAQMKPFVGDSGRELSEHYLPLAGLTRDMVFVTNASRCPGPGISNPSPKQVEECTRRHLRRELESARPEIIVALGRSACSLFDRPIDLSESCGVPQQNSLLGGFWTGTVLPIYHPAAGIRQTRLIGEIERGFRRLFGLIRGTVPVERSPWICRAMSQDDIERMGREAVEVAVDTESLEDGQPYLVSFCWDGITGLVLTAWSDRIPAVAKALSGKLLVFHNAAWDVPVLESIGLSVGKWHDTMIMAHVLGDLPLGLKQMYEFVYGGSCKRYDDVVGPHHDRAMKAWKEAVAAMWPSKAGAPRKSIDPSKVPVSVLQVVGPPPPRDLSLVPFPEAIEYAGQDAVITYRLYRELRRRCLGFHRRVS